MVAYERVFKTVFDWETKRLFTKWSLTGGGRLREVVVRRELTVNIPSTVCTIALLRVLYLTNQQTPMGKKLEIYSLCDADMESLKGCA